MQEYPQEETADGYRCGGCAEGSCNYAPPPPTRILWGYRGVFEDRQAVHIVQELCEGGAV